MRLLCSLVIAVWAACTVRAAWQRPLDDKPRLHELDHRYLDRNITNGQPWIVVFTFNNCRHCRQFEPLFMQLADQYSRQGISFGKVDVTYSKVLRRRFKISRVPTVLFVQGTSYYFFTGPRERHLLEQFVKREMVGTKVDWETSAFGPRGIFIKYAMKAGYLVTDAVHLAKDTGLPTWMAYFGVAVAFLTVLFTAVWFSAQIPSG